MVTIDDLQQGQVYTARNQGTSITPTSLKVTIHWVGPNSVHYLIEGSPEISETSVERFLSIVNQ